MLRVGSPAKLVMVRVILNLHVTFWELMSYNGEHASVLRKPEVIAEHPPDSVRFNNLPHGCAGELSSSACSGSRDREVLNSEFADSEFSVIRR